MWDPDPIKKETDPDPHPCIILHAHYNKCLKM